MQYALLIHTPEIEPTQEEMGKYFAYTSDVKAKNMYVGGHALQAGATATTVRVRDGRTMVHDGPFAETKEQLGGIYVLECKDLDEAIEYAAKIPGASRGVIEVRPVMVFPGQ